MSMYFNAYMQNLVKNGKVISEKSKFKSFYVNNLGPRSRNDFDLENLSTFIYSFSCPHLPTSGHKVAIVSEKSSFHFFL